MGAPLNAANYIPVLKYGGTIDITMSASSVDTETGLDMSDADNLTTGTIANFTSNSSDTGTRTLVKVINDNTAATGTTVANIQQDAAATSLNIDHNAATGSALVIDGEQTTAVMVDFAATVLTTGTALDIGDLDALTTGKGINIQGAGEALTSGIYLDVGHAGSGSNADATGNIAKFASSITDTDTTGTATENYDVVLISRTDVMNGAGGTLDADGALLKLESTATQTAGTLTQDVAAIEIATNSRSTSDVYAIKVTHDNAGSGAAGAVDASSFSVDEPVIKFITDSTGSAVDPAAHAGTDDWLCVKNSAGTLLFIPCYAAT